MDCSADHWVYSFPDGIDCYSGSGPNATTGVCEVSFNDPMVFLYAEAASNSPNGFLGWSGNCIILEPGTCQTSNPGDGSTVEVRATFVN